MPRRVLRCRVRLVLDAHRSERVSERQLRLRELDRRYVLRRPNTPLRGLLRRLCQRRELPVH
jgi:hypothetical protein